MPKRVWINLINAPGAIRTPDLRIRSPLLYPTELQARIGLEIHNTSEPIGSTDGKNIHKRQCVKVFLALSCLANGHGNHPSIKQKISRRLRLPLIVLRLSSVVVRFCLSVGSKRQDLDDEIASARPESLSLIAMTREGGLSAGGSQTAIRIENFISC